MRYEVPQFIEVEQHVIGPFTWKQFIYLAGGAGALALTYFTLPFILFMLTGVPVAIFAAFLAYRKINGRSFEIFAESVFNFFTRNKFYRWNIDAQRKYTVTYAEKPIDTTLEAPTPTTTVPQIGKSLNRLKDTLQENEMNLIAPTPTTRESMRSTT